MCSDYNIYLAFFQICNRFFLLCRCAESTEQIHTHRELFHSLNKSIVDLLCQDCSRYKINNLTAFLNCFKRSPKSYFCLTISNISTYKTVHDLGAFHVLFGIFNRCQLVFCFLIRKHFFKLPLPDSIRTTDITFFFLADRIKLYKLLCNILHGTANSGFCLFPFLTSKPVQLWWFCRLRTGIFLQCIQLRRKNIQITSITILNLDIVFCNFIYSNLLDTLVNTKSMFLMDYIISNGQFREILNSFSVVLFFLFALLLFFSKNIRLCDNRKFYQRIFKPSPCMAICHHDFSRLQYTVRILSIKRIKTFFLKILCQTFCTGS